MKRLLQITILLCFMGFTNFQVVNSQSIQEQLAGKYQKVVDINGSGDYTSIAEAISAVSSGTVIFVKNGIYNEKVEIPSGKYNISIIGESVDSTILTYNDYSGSKKIYDGIISSKVGTEIGTSSSHTLYIDADNVTLMNMTVINSAGNVGQAVAVNLGADKTVIGHCRILGHQDTFYTWGKGRFYIKDTYIEGNTDFIFGRGAVLFDSCIINSNGSSTITAASTDDGWKYGEVFQYCRLTANNNVGGASLGRPWGELGQTVFMYCYMAAHISKYGWSTWDGRENTCFYAEYDNYGPGYIPESRVSWSHQLTESEAQEYTKAKILAGDISGDVAGDWIPDVYTNEIYNIILHNDGLVYYDSLYNNAFLTDLKYNDISLENFNQKTYIYNVELEEGTSQVPEITTSTLSPMATVTVEDAQAIPGKTVVSVKAQNGYILKYNINFTIASSINELSENDKIHILSNPFNEKIELEIKEINSDISLIIYNVAGQQVISNFFKKDELNNNIITLNTAFLKGGFYFYNIVTDKHKYSGKLIKHN